MVLTAIPFLLVVTRVIAEPRAIPRRSCWSARFAQILVHMVFFLHLTPKAEGGWMLISTVFTMILVVITLAGSLWIVFHLNRNMMPAGIEHEMLPENAPEAPSEAPPSQ